MFTQTDTTLTIYGESHLFEGDSKNPELILIFPNGGETYESLDLINLQWAEKEDGGYEYSDAFNALKYLNIQT